MSGDPLAPVWSRLDSEPPVFFGDRPEPAFAAVRDNLVQRGFVRAAEPSRFAVCRACGGGHVRRVAWVEDAASGTRRPCVPCPECGLTFIDADHLRTWAIDVPHLLAGVTAAARGQGEVQEIVRGRLWFLGRIPSLGRRHSAYFARAVHGHERPAVLAALTPHPRALLFHPTEHAMRSWESNTPNPTLALESVVNLGPAGLTVDAATIEARLVDAGFGAPKPRVQKRRAERAASIEILVKELREWLNGAKNHVNSFIELGRIAKLPPRPTQKELSKLTDLSETTVSRCLNDTQAIVLKLLWEKAVDLQSVLEWDGSVGGDSP